MFHRALLIAALVVPAAPAAAQTAPRPAAPAAAAPAAPAPLSRQLFIQTMDVEFRKIDADKDGKLTRGEIEAYQRAVSILQIQARNRAVFTSLDADRNGQLTQQEFAAFQSAPPKPNAAPLLAQVDINKDQAVTMIEYRTGKLVNFDRIDADKDSVVTQAEMRAAGLAK